ncbi:hypothetical protein G9A89_018257 [Geosiphon pyriformis]|nr:hypothetical protein G9A89_018257 [Geosiphon pyriformis]
MNGSLLVYMRRKNSVNPKRMALFMQALLILAIGGYKVYNCRNCGIMIEMKIALGGSSSGHCLMEPWSYSDQWRQFIKFVEQSLNSNKAEEILFGKRDSSLTFTNPL